MSLALYSVQYNHYVIAESAAKYQTHPLGPTIVDEKYQTAQTKFAFSSYSPSVSDTWPEFLNKRTQKKSYSRLTVHRKIIFLSLYTLVFRWLTREKFFGASDYDLKPVSLH